MAAENKIVSLCLASDSTNVSARASSRCSATSRVCTRSNLRPSENDCCRSTGADLSHGNTQRGSIDVVPVDAQSVRYAGTAPLVHPDADPAANIQHRGRLQELVDHRDHG